MLTTLAGCNTDNSLSGVDNTAGVIIPSRFENSEVRTETGAIALNKASGPLCMPVEKAENKEVAKTMAEEVEEAEAAVIIAAAALEGVAGLGRTEAATAIPRATWQIKRAFELVQIALNEIEEQLERKDINSREREKAELYLERVRIAYRQILTVGMKASKATARWLRSIE
jgi:mannitol-1-phosphate/altronate dehydrogenase